MRSLVRSVLKSPHVIWYVLFTSAILHLLIIWLSTPYANFDNISVRIVGEKIMRGENIYPYTAISRHPYFPLFLYFEALSYILATKLLSQVVLLKLLFSLANLGIVYLVYILSKKNLLLTFLYAINPISLLITCFQGQLDSIPLFFMLLSIHLLTQKQKTSALLALSGAIAFKTWPILFIVPYLRKIYRSFSAKKLLVDLMVLMSIPFFCTFIYSFLFHANPLFIGKVVLSYGGVNNVWGIGKALFMLFNNNKLIFFFFKMLCMLALFLFEIKSKEKTIYSQLFMAFLLFFVITPGFGIQYFFWLIPFGFLSKQMKGKGYFSMLCSIGATYLVFAGIPIPSIWVEAVYFCTWMILSLDFLESRIYPMLK